ncbi:Asp-tRNA(Asn)/Glu-tRNA(Gln) amidotransferase subunit GatC [Megamonas hypermegale]|uniref:Aspartyl/glutamyl-tRNA(Asn/Gln) amidotransferase subunit C n=1 Tax=Megamonas hypermegale TaxID=158847 RepID=A0A921L9M9_9FIRM|nr:Asp-tRNA(Asn)/Glu-tRNA(Gln) amidotransferase subunit GatC [Megamonas hypermegale]MDM8143272.1 Asp-tRNA(Asn)/Glu-tRNA(Gln) amidotransferase subunit GatC [Megamonas hypermegale]HJF85156.1 Asp-tRNA(Asn)/Glu-tRNA(Gln) amidotransferase subunit GatC [Megamonas hypermegale]
MKVTREDVENVALLSRLSIDEKDMDKNIQELSDFLEYVDRLQQVDTENVMPTAHVLPIQNVFREDVVKPSLDRDLALSNAPESEDGYFRVPKIIEE